MRDHISAEPVVECPDRTTWIDFFLGQVAVAPQDRLADHLALCPHCQDFLAELEDVRDDLVLGLRQPLPHDSILREPAFARLEANLSTLSIPEEASDFEDEEDRPPREPGTPIATLKRLGRFQILEYRGHGGFGLVYRAFDPNLKREVALKVPRIRDLLSESSRQRMVREGWAASRLNHRNILPIYEADEVDEVSYIASEYCQGPTLAEWLDGQTDPVPFRLAARLVATLAEAVQHAHGRGILHRDIKPSNVLLDPSDDPQWADFGYLPKLTDFGLAKFVIEESAGLDLVSTQAGAILGTPEYMAREQAVGQSQDVDVRTDVYALGVLLYRLLTGVTPFKGDSPLATLRQVEIKDPKPPSRLRAKLPRDLEVICLKCLEKSQAKRYDSAALLAEDLRSFLAGGTIKARPAGIVERTWKGMLRRPALAVFLASIALAVPTFTTVLFFNNQQLQRAVQRAERSERTVRQRLYAANLSQAWQAWQAGNMDQFRDLLDRCRADPGQGPDADFRGFEWGYLRGLAEAPEREQTLRGHMGGVCCVRYAPDGSLLATGGLDGRVKLWDPRTERELATLSGHQSDVNRISFSPDGKTLASVSDDRTVRIWDVPGRRIRFVLDDHPDRLFFVAFAPDGQLLAVGGRGNDIQLWDPGTGRAVGRLPSDKVVGLAFAPSGRRLLSAHEDQQLRAWDLSGLDHGPVPSCPPAGLSGPTGPGHVTELAIAPDGRTFATAKTDSTTLIWETRGNRLLETLHGHYNRVVCVAYSPDGKFLATGGRDTQIRIWRANGTLFGVLQNHGDSISSLDFSPDGQTLASASQDGTLKLWSWRDQAGPSHRPRLVIPYASPLPCLALTADGSVLVAACTDRFLRWLELPLGGELASIPADDDARQYCLTLSSDERLLFVGTGNGEVVVWDVPSRTRLRRFRVGGISAHMGLACSRDGSIVATGDLSRYVRLWDGNTGRELAALDCRDGWMTNLAFSPDDRTLATGGKTGLTILWDLATRRERAILRGHGDRVRSVAFSPDGRTLATASEDRTIRFWDVPTGRERETLRGHRDWVQCLAFSPDGKTLVSGGRDGTVKFWQAATGLPLFSADRLHADGVTTAVFARDGRTLVTGAYDGAYKLHSNGEAIPWRSSGVSGR